VLDISAVLRHYLPDGSLPEGSESAVVLAVRGDAALLAPQPLFVEIAAVLLKKERTGAITASAVEAIFKAVLDLPLLLRGHSRNGRWRRSTSGAAKG